MSLPPRHPPRLGEGRDWVPHAVAHAILGALVARALHREHTKSSFLLFFLMSVGWCAGFGLVDEWHQKLVQRTCCRDDWIADVIGAAAGAAAGSVYRRQRRGEPTMSDARRVSGEELDQEIAKPGPCVVEFWMNGCPACARFASTFGELAEEYQERANLMAIEARENMEASQKHAIRGVPTIIVFKDGAEVQRTTGAKTLAEMREWLEPVLG